MAFEAIWWIAVVLRQVFAYGTPNASSHQGRPLVAWPALA